MRCFQCMNQINPTEDVYRLENDPYHTVCEACAKKEVPSIDDLPESESNYIIATYFTANQKRNLIKRDPLAYSYYLHDRLSDMRYGEAQDYEEVG